MDKVAVRPIRNEEDYRAALAEIDHVIDAPDGSPEAELLEVLSVLVGAYEDEHYPIKSPHPIAFLEFVMEQRGLTRKDLEPYIGTRARVNEIMNRQRRLSIEMIRRLSQGLDLPADVLLQPYEVSGKQGVGSRV